MRLRERAFEVASLAIGVFALALSWSASSLYGLGIDADGVWNLSAGVSLAEGRGLVTCRDDPFTLWPPLYPLVMAALELAHVDVLAGLRVLHLAALAATLALSARLAFVLSGSRWAVLATLGSLTLSARVHEFTIQVLSESFFVPLVLSAVLAARAWFEHPTRARWLALVFVSALACLQRYVGAALVLSVAGALLCTGPGGLAARALRAMHYAAASVAPLLAWFARNYRVQGAFTGGREAAIDPTETIASDTLSTLARWIAPDGAPLWIAAALYALAAVLVARALLDPQRRRDWALSVSTAGAYLLLVVFMAATVRVDRIADRLLFPALPLLVALGWASCFRTLASPRWLAAVLVVVLVSWSSGALRLRGHHERWRSDGAGTLHTRLWQEHALTRELRRLSIRGPCWSNAPELVWMLQRIPVRFLASGSRAWTRAGERAALNGGELAWFQQDGKPKGALPDLARVVRTSPLATVEDGLLLRLHPADER